MSKEKKGRGGKKPAFEFLWGHHRASQSLSVLGSPREPSFSYTSARMTRPAHFITGQDQELEGLMHKAKDIIPPFVLNTSKIVMYFSWSKIELKKTPECSQDYVSEMVLFVTEINKRKRVEEDGVYWLVRDSKKKLLKLYNLAILMKLYPPDYSIERESGRFDEVKNHPRVLSVVLLFFHIAKTLWKEPNSPQNFPRIRSLIMSVKGMFNVYTHPKITCQSRVILSSLYIPSDMNPYDPNLVNKSRDTELSRPAGNTKSRDQINGLEAMPESIDELVQEASANAIGGLLILKFNSLKVNDDKASVNRELFVLESSILESSTKPSTDAENTDTNVSEICEPGENSECRLENPSGPTRGPKKASSKKVQLYDRTIKEVLEVAAWKNNIEEKGSYASGRKTLPFMDRANPVRLTKSLSLAESRKEELDTNSGRQELPLTKSIPVTSTPIKDESAGMGTSTGSSNIVQKNEGTKFKGGKIVDLESSTHSNEDEHKAGGTFSIPSLDLSKSCADLASASSDDKSDNAGKNTSTSSSELDAVLNITPKGLQGVFSGELLSGTGGLPVASREGLSGSTDAKSRKPRYEDDQKDFFSLLEDKDLIARNDFNSSEEGSWRTISSILLDMSVDKSRQERVSGEEDKNSSMFSSSGKDQQKTLGNKASYDLSGDEDITLSNLMRLEGNIRNDPSRKVDEMPDRVLEGDLQLSDKSEIDNSTCTDRPSIFATDSESTLKENSCIFEMPFSSFESEADSEDRFSPASHSSFSETQNDEHLEIVSKGMIPRDKWKKLTWKGKMTYRLMRRLFHIFIIKGQVEIHRRRFLIVLKCMEMAFLVWSIMRYLLKGFLSSVKPPVPLLIMAEAYKGLADTENFETLRTENEMDQALHRFLDPLEMLRNYEKTVGKDVVTKIPRDPFQSLVLSYRSYLESIGNVKWDRNKTILLKFVHISIHIIREFLYNIECGKRPKESQWKLVMGFFLKIVAYTDFLVNHSGMELFRNLSQQVNFAALKGRSFSLTAVMRIKMLRSLILDKISLDCFALSVASYDTGWKQMLSIDRNTEDYGRNLVWGYACSLYTYFYVLERGYWANKFQGPLMEMEYTMSQCLNIVKTRYSEHLVWEVMAQDVYHRLGRVLYFEYRKTGHLYYLVRAEACYKNAAKLMKKLKASPLTTVTTYDTLLHILHLMHVLSNSINYKFEFCLTMFTVIAKASNEVIALINDRIELPPPSEEQLESFATDPLMAAYIDWNRKERMEMDWYGAWIEVRRFKSLMTNAAARLLDMTTLKRFKWYQREAKELFAMTINLRDRKMEIFLEETLPKVVAKFRVIQRKWRKDLRADRYRRDDNYRKYSSSC